MYEPKTGKPEKQKKPMKNSKFQMKTGFTIIAVLFFMIPGFVFSQNGDLQLGYDYINEGKYSDAIRIFEQHLISDPSDMTVRMQLAYLYKSQGRTFEAMREFEMVSLNSTDNEQVIHAKDELFLLQKSKELNELDQAYSFLDKKMYSEAIAKFESYYSKNPNDMKVAMQLGYIYKMLKDYNNAIKYFEIIETSSPLTTETNAARDEITSIRNILNPPVQTTTYTPVTTTDKLSLAYAELQAGNKQSAITLFEDYLSLNPGDMNTKMQLAYLYAETENISKAREYFSFVAQNSFDDKQRIDARTAFNNLSVTTSRFSSVGKSAIDIYFYNIYDSYQENFISNFLGRYSYNFAPRQSAGVYADLYVDSKSTPEAPLNDRYIETGIFYRYSFAPQLSFELRAGYVNLFDKKETKFNLRPILTFSNRFGKYVDYLKPGASTNTSLYIDAYAAGLYDLKYENVFGQVTLREVARFLTGGYSNFEVYLKQSIFKDSQKLDYNNYAEVGGGLSFKPNLKEFPSIFVEATNKIYFDDNRAETFQIKAGFLINLYSFL
ncbi:MAG: tetratricopeptide repeat protein [Chlorobi bacterium OLB4]|jgi:hypothetical protein|nr:MAG: tetratricopeptide repeat protein [Chlorobi bacterium OLB4]OQY78005.1 MAG: hypothetical protein B6D43_05690 [Ignavibacteriales bacterium UTCHB1]